LTCFGQQKSQALSPRGLKTLDTFSLSAPTSWHTAITARDGLYIKTKNRRKTG
ncbi:hypothetical protein M9458_011223, partial [Cirrhinus mrigala]